MRKGANTGGTAPTSNILKHGEQDIFVKNPIFLVFENELQAELFNARCHDTGEKLDAEKAKMFKEELSKINSKKHPQVLNLYSMRLGVNSIMKLVTLIKNRDYDTLNLADNAISQYGIHAIKNLVNSTRVVHLNLSSNMISEVGLSMILDDLVKNTHLKTLDLGVIDGSIRKNSLGIDGARCIAALLIQNKSLETIKLEDNDIGIAGAEIIAIALKQNKTLKHFKLSENMIKTQGAEQILKNAMHLQSLDLGKNFIKSSIGSFLRTYFDANKQIRRLNFEMNELTSEGVKTLCRGIQNSRLAFLNLRGNVIKDQGAIYLAELYDTGSECLDSLEELDVSSNDITPEGFVHLGRMLAKSKLKYLNVSKNLMGDEGLAELMDAVEQSESRLLLNRLDIGSCKVADKGLIRLLQGLDSLSDLQHVRAQDNYVSDKYEKIIVELLQKNNSLISLVLTGNRLSLSCLKAVKKIMDRNNKELEEREPNRIKSEIYRLKEKQKKIAEAKERLELQNREIVTLEETKVKLLESIAKLERDESQKRADFEVAMQRKREEIEKKGSAIKHKIEELELEKLNKEQVLEGLHKDIKEVTEKRIDLQYQIRITQEEGKLIESQFNNKTEAMKQQSIK